MESPRATTGYSFADLLLGLPYNSGRNPSAPRFNQTAYFYQFFGQDDWKLNQHLTLNLGVRYEYDQPMFDAHNLISNFNLATGTQQVLGQGGLSRYLYNPDFNNFGPRVGFAWQPYASDKTVFRIRHLLQPAGLCERLLHHVHAGTLPDSADVYLRRPQRECHDEQGSHSRQSLSHRSSRIIKHRHWCPAQLPDRLHPGLELRPAAGFDGQLLRGTHLLRLQGHQAPDADPGQSGYGGDLASLCPYPSFANVTYAIADASSEYHSLQTKLQQNLTHGVSYLLAYTVG